MQHRKSSKVFRTANNKYSTEAYNPRQQPIQVQRFIYFLHTTLQEKNKTGKRGSNTVYESLHIQLFDNHITSPTIKLIKWIAYSGFDELISIRSGSDDGDPATGETSRRSWPLIDRMLTGDPRWGGSVKFHGSWASHNLFVVRRSS